MFKKASSVFTAIVCAASITFSGASLVLADGEIDEQTKTTIETTAEGLTNTIIPLTEDEIAAYMESGDAFTENAMTAWDSAREELGDLKKAGSAEIEYSNDECSNGYCNRAPHGDRHGSTGRYRYHPQEHVHRRAGRAGPQGEARRERHDLRSGDHFQGPHRRRRAEPDEREQDRRHSGRGCGQDAYRHRHQPRPAFPARHVAPHRGGDDARRPPRDDAQSRTLPRPGNTAQQQDRKGPRGGRRRPSGGADHL